MLIKLVYMSRAGLNLKYLRKFRGWTQEEFAHKLNIKRSLIGAYEEERADPRLDVLETVAEMFKLTLDELLLQDLSVNNQAPQSFLAKRRQQKMMSADRNLIHFVPVKAAAGYLTSYADSEFIDELNTFTLKCRWNSIHQPLASFQVMLMSPISPRIRAPALLSAG